MDNFHFTAYLQYFVALVAVLNPIGNLSVFISFTANLYKNQRKKANIVVGTTICIVLTTSILFGETMLSTFGISIEAFKITGGILLVLNALNMLNGSLVKQGEETSNNRNASNSDDSYIGVMVVPLTIPMLAGPGSISTAIVWSQNYPSLFDTVGLIIASSGIGLITWLIFSSSDWIIKTIGEIGTNVVTKISALIIFAIGVEFVISAIGEKFPSLLG